MMLFSFTGSLSKKLIAAMLGVSSIVTLVATIFQLSFDYHQDVKLIEHNLNLVGSSRLLGISKAVWDLDDSQVKIQIESLLNVPDLLFVELIDNDNRTFEVGQKPTSRHVLERQFPLEYRNEGHDVSMGTLKVYANLENVYSRLFKKIFLIFFTQLLKTLIVTFFIYLIIQKMLTKKLFQVISYVDSFDFRNSPKELQLENYGGEDEFTVMVSSINRMRSDLITSYGELSTLAKELESKVEEKTREVLDQRLMLEHASKMTALGEMAGGIAHEINTPLAVIKMHVEQMEECAADGKIESMDLGKGLDVIKKTVDRIAKIVSGLRFFAREGQHVEAQKIKVSFLVEETLGLCQEKFANHGIQINVLNDDAYLNAELECRLVEISQVLLNLLNNAFDAVASSHEKWINIQVLNVGDRIEIMVTDSGPGIPKPLQDKIMQPFFSTKEIGKGTGLGLSLSKGIIEGHGGQFYLDGGCENTRFIISLPKTQHGDAHKRNVA